MSKPSLKDLVNYIEKFGRGAAPPKPGQGYVAETAPVAPAANAGGTTPAGRKAPPKPGQHAPVAANPGTVAIQKMQLAMQDLGKTISSTINYNQLMASMNQPQNADKKQFEKSYGRDAFSNFMVNRYLRNSSVKGEEFDTNVAKTKMPEKNPSDLKSMFVVLDTLNRIGKGNSEFKADGAWGPRTNNALRNISAIAESVMKLGSDLGMQAKSFDASKLSTLNPLIPPKDSDISPQEKATRAPQITELLLGVKSLFLEFKEQVLSNPNYGAFINENEPLFKNGPKKDKPLDLQGGEKTIYDDLVANTINSRFTKDVNGKVVPVATVTLPPEYTGNKSIGSFQLTGADLLNEEAFNGWVARNPALASIKKSNPDTWNNVVGLLLNNVKAQITNSLSTNSQPQTEQKA